MTVLCASTFVASTRFNLLAAQTLGLEAVLAAAGFVVLMVKSAGGFALKNLERRLFRCKFNLHVSIDVLLQLRRQDESRTANELLKVGEKTIKLFLQWQFERVLFSPIKR